MKINYVLMAFPFPYKVTSVVDALSCKQEKTILLDIKSILLFFSLHQIPLQAVILVHKPSLCAGIIPHCNPQPVSM